MGIFLLFHCFITAGPFMMFGFLTIVVSKICFIFIHDRSDIKWLPICCNILMIFLMVAFVIVTALQSAIVFVDYAGAANGTDPKYGGNCGTAQKFVFPMAILSYCILALTCCFCCSTCFHAWCLKKDDI